MRFTSWPDTAPGSFCLYMQAGGLYQGLPDGRLTVVAQPTFYSGDTLAIELPTSNAATFAGTASEPEELYAFFSPSPCAASAQTERGEAVGNFFYWPVHGAFSPSLPLLAGSTGNLCAYLQVGSPANGIPTGPTLVAANRSIQVP